MKYNGKLAITAFICGISIWGVIITEMVARLMGAEALVTVSGGNSVVSVLRQMMLVPLIIVFFKPKKVLN